MMKLNSCIQNIILLVCVFVGLASCSSDDDNEVTIVGKWELTQFSQSGKIYPDIRSIIVFNNDGTFTRDSWESNDVQSIENDEGTYTYSAESKELVRIYKDKGYGSITSTANVELSASTLKVVYTDGDMGVELLFNKIK